MRPGSRQIKTLARNMLVWRLRDIRSALRGSDGSRVDGLALCAQLDDSGCRRLVETTGLELSADSTKLSVEAKIYLDGSAFFLDGHLNGEIWSECSWCLGPARVDLSGTRIVQTFLPPSSAGAPSAEEQALSLEDLDTSVHDGEVIDLVPIVRDALVLALPIAPKCGNACPGIASPATGRGISRSDRAERAKTGQEGDDNQWKASLRRLGGEE